MSDVGGSPLVGVWIEKTTCSKGSDVGWHLHETIDSSSRVGIIVTNDVPSLGRIIIQISDVLIQLVGNFSCISDIVVIIRCICDSVDVVDSVGFVRVMAYFDFLLIFKLIQYKINSL